MIEHTEEMLNFEKRKDISEYEMSRAEENKHVQKLK